MAWGSKVSATQLTSITTIQYFSFSGDAFFTLNPGESIHIQVDVNFPSTPTDYAIVEVYSTLDPSTENWDDTPIFSMYVDKSIDPDAASFVISGIYKGRIGVRRSGATDTITSADCAYRKDGVSL